FEGRVAIDKELPTLDLVILTSISEAQPLVGLEAGAAGLPVITTDVGCCDELLNGRTPEDRALGPGGLITPIASPGETAKAVMQLYEDEGLRKKMGKNLMERVKAYYDQGDMVGSYRDVYRTQLERTVV
ncbi:MAG: GT4 family glycosyltransferase PelF, partial [Planctomycetota bacterium]